MKKFKQWQINQIIVLCYAFGYSYSKIAEIVGCSKSYVSKVLYREAGLMTW